jgi:ferric-dicitrate binding protein FerR (iron transport regulator)
MLAEVRGTQFRAIEDGAASWLAVRSGNVRVRRDVDGKRVDLSKGRYVVVHPSAPFGPIPAAQCPYWRSRCRLSVGDQYP